MILKQMFNTSYSMWIVAQALEHLLYLGIGVTIHIEVVQCRGAKLSYFQVIEKAVVGVGFL